MYQLIIEWFDTSGFYQYVYANKKFEPMLTLAREHTENDISWFILNPDGVEIARKK